MSPGSAKVQKRPRLVVVSGYGNDAITPRGQRTKRLTEAFGRAGWDVEQIAMRGKPSSARPGGSRSRWAPLRRLVGRVLSRVLLDRWEPWALGRLATWRPDVDAALLIAAPWSPVVHASRRLVRAGIPYVVDVGDPWVVTADYKAAGVPIRRARRGELFLWRHAAGAVVTTGSQCAALRRRFPEIPILVRPNGYTPVSLEGDSSRRRRRVDSSLRLAHFGMLSERRLAVPPVLTALKRSGLWDSVSFVQFGDDFGSGLDAVPDGVRVEHRDPRPWGKVAQAASEFDAVVAVGWPLPALLPSKAVEYSTLPVPRIAITNPDDDDALRAWARSHAGWLAISVGERNIGPRVEEIVARDWTPRELAPAAEDAWPAVADRVVDFVQDCVSRPRPRPRSR